MLSFESLCFREVLVQPLTGRARETSARKRLGGGHSGKAVSKRDLKQLSRERARERELCVFNPSLAFARSSSFNPAAGVVGQRKISREECQGGDKRIGRTRKEANAAEESPRKKEKTVGGAEGRRRGKRVSNRNVFLLLQAFLSFPPPPPSLSTYTLLTRPGSWPP